MMPESAITMPGIADHHAGTGDHDGLELAIMFDWNARSQCAGLRMCWFPERDSKASVLRGRDETPARSASRSYFVSARSSYSRNGEVPRQPRPALQPVAKLSGIRPRTTPPVPAPLIQAAQAASRA